MSFTPEMSTDSICVKENTTYCLSDLLDTMQEDISTLGATKASSTHTHTAASIGAAASTHTHAQADVTGLVDKLASIDSAISELQAGSGSSVSPILVASMHLGKLDNNNGAELSSTTRICSDPFAVESGKSYWQVNDNGVNMYVLLYDADEVFLEYVGNFASGAEIAVTNSNAAYMRLSSLVGEYDLTNEFRIYDVDPSSASSGEDDAFTQADADLLYAPISHTHDGYASADHTHTGYAASDHTHTGFATSDHTHTASEVGAAPASHTHTASDITGLPSSVDAYSRTEADQKFAVVGHTHTGYAEANHTHADYLTEEEAVDAFAGINHTHTGFASADHTHTGFAAADHTHDGYAASNHTHTEYAASSHSHSASDVGAAPVNHTHTASEVGAASSDHTHSEYAAASHTHSGYASSNHTHTASEVGAAAANHSHSGYASSSHTHTPASIGAAASSHTHSEYSLSGHSHTTNGSCEFTGTLRTRDIVSGNPGECNIGGYSNRYKYIYSVNQLQVSSDERMKKDICGLSTEDLAAFVDALNVVEYKYKADKDGKARIGLIAQEVIKASPELASYFVREESDGMLGLSVADLVFPLIAAVQELSKRVKALEG